MQPLALVLLHLFALCFLPQITALPAPVMRYERTVLPRAAQDATGPPTTVQTTTTTQTCVIFARLSHGSVVLIWIAELKGQ